VENGENPAAMAARTGPLPITKFAHKAGNGELTISCRNRHCPKCQGSQALAWMAERKAELLQVPYFHVVFTLPAEIGAIAYQNKAVIYALLFKAASDTMLTIAADPKHLGAKIGITAVLHTWGSAMTQNPHSRYRALSSP
jgi:Transposase zinc-binding domain